MPSVARLPQDSGTPRFIDPNAALEDQIPVFKLLIKDPPENSRIITFSPELSEWILENLNTANRKRKPSRIKRYGDIMLNEAWILNGDTIKFSRARVLLDGQNRLAGSVRSGKSFRTHVIFGIDDAAFATIDANKVRTNSDTLYRAGVVHSEIVTPAIRWLMIWANPNDSGVPNRGMTLDNTAVLEYWRSQVDHDRMMQAVERTLRVPRGEGHLAQGSLAGLLYLFDGKATAVAKRFALDLERNQRGARVLRKRLKKQRGQNLGRIQENQHNAFIIQTWNAYREGRIPMLRELNWNDTRDYPVIN